MRWLLILALGAAPLAMPAAAQQRPTHLGDHGAWTAASFVEGGRKVCYAFARPTRSQPDGRKEVLLTVTHRPDQRDMVILSAGYAYPRNAEVKVSVGATELKFYTAGSNAAAIDKAAAIRAFRGGRDAVARGPLAGGNAMATDTFPLSGFSAAYDTITASCPPPGRRP